MMSSDRYDNDSHVTYLLDKAQISPKNPQPATTNIYSDFTEKQAQSRL